MALLLVIVHTLILVAGLSLLVAEPPRVDAGALEVLGVVVAAPG